MKRLRWLASAAGVVCVSFSTCVAQASDGGASDAGATDGGRLAEGGLDGAANPAMDASLAPPTHAVGKACKKDGDCASGLVCLTSATDSLGTGGPAGGLCTVSCTTNGQEDCNRVDTGSTCASYSTGASKYCLESCDFAAPADGSPKCHDRVDFACSPPQAVGTGLCIPMCRGDYDCPGRACDPKTGLCANAASGSLPVGSSCDPSASDDCIGQCGTLGSGASTVGNSFCTLSCTLGRPGTCGQSPTASGPQPAGCIFKFSSTSTDGDLGECAQLCDCDSDCRNPAFVCHENPLAQQSGHTGACVPKLTFDGVTSGMPCGAGGQPPVLSEAGAPPMDAAAPARDAGTDGGVTAVSATGGCSCRTGATAPDERAPALLAVFAALALRRRNAPHIVRKR